MRLTVLNVSYPLAPVGPDAVGGAEQVLHAMDAALVAAGHRSLVVAPAGSVVCGTHVQTPARRGRLDERARTAARESHRRAIAHALERWAIDLVHMHGLDYDRYLPGGDVPVLATLHLPLDWCSPAALRPHRPATYIACVSDSQYRAAAARGLTPLLVRNGVALRAPGGVPKGDYVLTLGRICPEKGYHDAMDAARMAGVRLLLAGRTFRYPDHVRYFREEILPRCDTLRRFIGAAAGERKRRLLAGARCLLVPSRVEETSSLVAMEALACGTPVIAYPSGALAEIVEHGRTGFLVRDAQEMASMIGAASRLDAGTCRRTARARFSAAAMVEGYLAVYRQLLRRAGREGGPPHADAWGRAASGQTPLQGPTMPA